MLLYHGSYIKTFTPFFGGGEERHDYGAGFYLTPERSLAGEWAASLPSTSKGWVHTYDLDMTGLSVLDFEEVGILSWLAELMKHRDADTSVRYCRLAPLFIEKYGVCTEGYDVLRGWRADASYFYIAREFVRDNVDVSILEELLRCGNLGIQYCCKSPKAFSSLREVAGSPTPVDVQVFRRLYTLRDNSARERVHALINSDSNTLARTFRDVLGE